MRVDQGVFGVPLDLMLELRDRMAGRDDEAPRVETDGLVPIATKRMSRLQPSCPHSQRNAMMPSTGSVSIASFSMRSVACHAPRVHLTAGCVAEDLHRLHQCSRPAATPDETVLVCIDGSDSRMRWRGV